MAQTLSLSDAINGGMSGMAGQLVDLSKQTADTSKARDVALKGLQSGVDKDEQEKYDLLDAAKKPGGALSPPAMTPQPETKETSPVEQWGSAAMWMAGLGGLLTRRPLTNALNAAGAVMNAYKQHDAAAAQSAYDTWKVENDNAMKMFQFANDSLKEQLSAVGDDEKTKFSNYQVVAKSLGDDQAASMKTYDEALKFVTTRQDHADKMRMAAPLIDARHQEAQLQLAALDAAKGVQAAKQSGNPAALKTAIQKAQDANDQLQAYKGTGIAAAQKAAASAPQFDAAISAVDKAIADVKINPTVVGLPGAIRRDLVEPVGGWTGVSKTAPAQSFETQIKTVQAAVRNLLKESKYMSAGAVQQLDDQVKGLSLNATPESTLESLAAIKDTINEERGKGPTEDTSSSGSSDLSSMSDEELLNALQE